MIGGNIIATILEKTTSKNEIGENETILTPLGTHLKGFLDYLTGESTYSTYNNKLSDTTHVFVCDYIDFKFDKRKHFLLIDDVIYDITLIDDPMNLHQHIEIYLKGNEAYNGTNIYK